MNQDLQIAGSLVENWLFARCEPGTGDLGDLDSLAWYPAVVPGTVAENLIHHDLWHPASGVDLDAGEYWFQCAFTADLTNHRLYFEGLATLAEVWLNGQPILNTDNMFRSHSVRLTDTPGSGQNHHLVIRFASLTAALAEKRPRAKWRTRLVAHRNLRFFRTSLLGRMPGICPGIPPIGPWKGIRLIPASVPEITGRRVFTRIDETINGVNGTVSVEFLLSGEAQRPATATLQIGHERAALQLRDEGGDIRITGEAVLDNVALWWPHTHGDPNRYPARLLLDYGHSTTSIELAPVGFRKIRLTGGIDDFELAVNDTPVHCRGGCWIPPDIVSMRDDPASLRNVLTLFRDAGMNMIRLSGITIYESDAFYRLCDELGILIWQDFMFASMHYPAEDPEFLHNVTAEAREFLERIGHCPSLTVFCSGSEIEQQVSMLGLPRALSESQWFDETLPGLCQSYRPDTVYCPHSPCGGALPFHSNKGVSHYFAVGGYRQSLSSTLADPPRFASECLAFSIPPENPLIDKEFRATGAVDWARYQGSIPRDNGSDWHFGEVTDHYVRAHFSIDPAELRSADESLYLSAARIAVGETMQRSVASWRYNGFTRGALIWTLRDFLPGAGWGILDSNGAPKAPYYFLKRAWQPVGLYFRDRGTNGLHIGLHNDSHDELHGILDLQLSSTDGRVVQQVSRDVVCKPTNSTEWLVDELFGGFIDSSYAYRFGPASFDIVTARFRTSDGGASLISHHRVIDQPLELSNPPIQPTLAANWLDGEPEGQQLSISTDRFVDYVILECGNGRPDDNYFGLIPGEQKIVTVTFPGGTPEACTVGAFNSPLRVSVPVSDGVP